MGFTGLLGVGVGGTLTLDGTDYNFTEVGGYEAVEVSGNVIDNDDVPAGTTVQSVDSQTVDQDGTTVQRRFRRASDHSRWHLYLHAVREWAESARSTGSNTR